jgi:hypothetical protein
MHHNVDAFIVIQPPAGKIQRMPTIRMNRCDRDGTGSSFSCQSGRDTNRSLTKSTLKRAESSSPEHGSHLGGQEAMIVVDDDRVRRDILVLVRVLVLAWIGKRHDKAGTNEYE